MKSSKYSDSTSAQQQLPQADMSINSQVTPNPTKPTTPNQTTYHQQPYRWVIVILVSIAFAINNLANNAIIPIASKVATIYNLSSTYANLPIQLSFLINPIVNFSAGHFMDVRGLGVSFRIGSVLYALGLFGFCLINYGYHWVLIGSILISLGQPLITNSPAKLATFWFNSQNRTLATGIISAINIVTLGVSLVFPAIFVDQQSYGEEAKDQIFVLYSRYFLAAVVNAFLIMFFMKGRPKKLPSAGAQQAKTHISQTIKIIKGDRNLWKFFAASMLLYGTFLSFGSTSNMLFKPYGFDDPQIALFGVCLLISGIVGSVLFTLYIKKTLNYKPAINFAVFSAVGFVICASIVMNYYSQHRWLISIMCLGMGFNLIPMVPISYDLGCELTFPVGEAQVVGIITGGSMIYTVVLTLTISTVVGFGTTMRSSVNMIIYIALFACGAVMYSLVKIKLKRRDHEQNLKNKGNDSNLVTMSESPKTTNLQVQLDDNSNSQQKLSYTQDASKSSPNKFLDKFSKLKGKLNNKDQLNEQIELGEVSVKE